MRGRSTDASRDPDAFVREHLVHNVLALGADFSLWMIGLSFASTATILPAFAAHLGAPNVVIGAIPAVMTTGWFLPSLFAAGHTESLARRLPFVMRYTVWERVPLLGLALAAFTIAERAPGLALAALLASLVVIATTGGVLMPAWSDIIGRVIPVTIRGRFFAFSGLAAGIGGLGGSVVTARILGHVSAPASYGICFLIAAAFMGLSYAALAVVREPEVPRASAPVGLRTYLRRVPGLVARDTNFSWFLAARAFAMLGAMASGFFTVYALRAHAAPDRWVGIFTTMLLAGNVVGTLVLGWVGDRAGHRLVLVIGVAFMLMANVVAPVATSLAAFATVFALLGFSQVAATTSNVNVLLEFAPTPDEQPTYVGLGNTSVAPVTFASPLIAGMIADAWGFELAFAIAAICCLVSLALFVGCVREPRHARA